MSPFLRIVLIFIGISAVIDIISVVKRLVPMVKRVNEIKRLNSSPDVISVEAEIVEVSPERLNDLDTQYDLKVYYEVGWRKFYKDFILINKQSLRVGQTITLLCDSSAPEKAMIQEQNGLSGLSGEGFGIKSTVFNLVIAVLVIIVDAILNCAEFM